jgi:hypothetical protein
VGGAGVGGADRHPLGFVVQQIQVAQYLVEPEGEVSADVLEDA